jgi:hypothetical protein
MATTTTTATEQARKALQTLQSLPNWDKIATIYIGDPQLLQDLADDLENGSWEELISD